MPSFTTHQKIVETEATTGVANDWEELVFDFGNQAEGTAAFNADFTYDRLSVFANFGVTGAEAGGAKTYYVDDITWIGGRGEVEPPADPMVTFRVDMNCAEHAFETVSVTGPFCEWCAAGFELADDDGDGVYEGTFPFAAGALEYKYMVDGFANQEDLIGDGDCAPITDGANFANRQAEIAGDIVLDETYGQCSVCGDVPPGSDFTSITFEEQDREYLAIAFGGTDGSAVVEDPTDAANTVLQINKSDAAQLWAGVTVAYEPNNSVERLPVDAGNTRLTARFWSPDAGIQVRVKTENANDPAQSVETEATTGIANDWEELVFDFANQAEGTAAFNADFTYDRLSVFANFGVTGAEVGEAKTYYIDDIIWVGGR